MSMRNRVRIGSAVLTWLVVAGTLCGCGASSAIPTSASPQPRQCGVDLHAAAIDAAARGLPESRDWKAPFVNEGSGNYDPCAALSGAIAIPGTATASAPVHILLFHQGEFVGTATPEPYRHAGIDAKQSTADTVVVGFHWRNGDECDACMTGVGYVRFQWDGEKVRQLDQLPPQALP